VGVLWIRATSTPAQTAPEPNFVFVVADDMRADDLEFMPRTRALLGEQGMRFRNAFVSDPVCCPSRATIMRGQYAHNTKVWFTFNDAQGGWRGYRENELERDNVATRLDDAGYRTALIGKYLNGYSRGTTHVPRLGQVVRDLHAALPRL
jgi:arylsulfatase A-like enzyme